MRGGYGGAQLLPRRVRRGSAAHSLPGCGSEGGEGHVSARAEACVGGQDAGHAGALPAAPAHPRGALRACANHMGSKSVGASMPSLLGILDAPHWLRGPDEQSQTPKRHKQAPGAQLAG